MYFYTQKTPELSWILLQSFWRLPFESYSSLWLLKNLMKSKITQMHIPMPTQTTSLSVMLPIKFQIQTLACSATWRTPSTTATKRASIIRLTSKATPWFLLRLPKRLLKNAFTFFIRSFTSPKLYVYIVPFFSFFVNYVNLFQKSFSLFLS